MRRTDRVQKQDDIFFFVKGRKKGHATHKAMGDIHLGSLRKRAAQTHFHFTQFLFYLNGIVLLQQSQKKKQKWINTDSQTISQTSYILYTYIKNVTNDSVISDDDGVTTMYSNVVAHLHQTHKQKRSVRSILILKHSLTGTTKHRLLQILH